MIKHTPGPWGLRHEYSIIYVEGKARDPRVTQGVAGIGPKEGGAEQQLADAFLISAAPDLLEALQALMRKVECGTALHCEVCDQARAAIAKARGGA